MADLNALSLRRKFFNMLAGLSFSGKRDLYNVLGYPRSLTTAELYALYERQDVAIRVVDMPVEGIWTDPPNLNSSSRFTKAWRNLIKKHELWTVLAQADKLCAFGPFSAILVGGGGPTNTTLTNLSDPLYLRAYGAGSIEIKDYVVDTSSIRFGLPETYKIKVGNNTSSAPTREVIFHWTRVIHIADRPVQGTLFGEPRLRQVYNLLMDIMKIAGGSAETYWLAANRGVQVDVDKEMELDPASAAALSDELEEYQHQLRRFIRTRGVTITSLGSDMADPRGVFSVLLGLLSGATGIPQRLLVGSEAGQLASEQDRANWADQLRRRRTAFAEPYVLRPVINHLAMIGVLPEVEDVTFEWPDPFHTSPLERAQTMAQQARAIVNMSRQADLGNPIATLEECRTIIGLPEEVPDGQTLPKPMKELRPVDPAAQNPTEEDDPDEPGQSTDEDGKNGAQKRENGSSLHQISAESRLLPRNSREIPAVLRKTKST